MAHYSLSTAFGLSCALSMCPHVPKSDATGCWGECLRCGNRAGFVSREVLRRYIDREIARREATQAPQVCTTSEGDTTKPKS